MNKIHFNCQLPLLCVMLLLSACQSAPVREVTPSAVISTQVRLLDERIEKLKMAAAELKNANQYLCTNYNADTLGIAQEKWRVLFTRWQGLQGINITLNEGVKLDGWLIQFWPDKKNLTANKIDNLLANPKATAETLQQLGKPANNIGAAEYFLFDEKLISQSTLQNTEQCQGLLWLSDSLKIQIQQLAQQYQQPNGVSAQLLLMANQDAAQQHYAITQLFGVLDAQIDVSAKKISTIIVNNEQVQPLFAEAWRADYSLTALRKQLSAIEEFYQGGRGGIGLDDLARQQGFKVHAEQFETRLKLAEHTLSQETDLQELMKDPIKTLDALQESYVAITQSRDALHQLAQDLNITLSFNATDGD
ncbi:MAG: hypothetical protein H0W44_07470 [Gammaproteobacteria bacterium]|nr:hypothetical protein [Gammaproteobacteria bacterium]